MCRGEVILTDNISDAEKIVNAMRKSGNPIASSKEIKEWTNLSGYDIQKSVEESDRLELFWAEGFDDVSFFIMLRKQ